MEDKITAEDMIKRLGLEQKPKFSLHVVMCSLGWHKWKITMLTKVKGHRKCNKCLKEQHTMYDMTYGSTYWANGKYW